MVDRPPHQGLDVHGAAVKVHLKIMLLLALGAALMAAEGWAFLMLTSSGQG